MNESHKEKFELMQIAGGKKSMEHILPLPFVSLEIRKNKTIL